MSTPTASVATVPTVATTATTSTTGLRRAAGWLARHAPTAARVVTGLAFLVFGLDYFLEFLPRPTTPPPIGAMKFGGALFETGYMFPLIKGTEVVVGALLLANRFVPLALVLIAPVIVNIVAFHAFLAPDEIMIALILLALELYLAWSYRDAYRGILTARAPRRA